MCDENSYLTKCLFNNLVFSTCKRHEYEEKPIRSLRSQWTNCVHLKPPLPLAIEFSLNESEIAEHSAVCNYCYETDTQCCTGRKPDAHRLRLGAWHYFGLRIRWKLMILSNPNLALQVKCALSFAVTILPFVYHFGFGLIVLHNNAVCSSKSVVII